LDWTYLIDAQAKMTKTKKPIKATSISYTGPSMNPILRSGDILCIIPYNGQKICQGDVIAFIPPEGDQKIIHRVIFINPEGIRTRGDSCTHVDPWILSPHHVIGRVIYTMREKRQRRIYGGILGFLYSMAIRAFRAMDSSVSFLLHPAYHWMSRGGVFGRWTEGLIKTRVLSFKRPDGIELQLLMGRRVVGRWLPGKDGWHIRRPFRLFVNEESLPVNPSKSTK
jgi:signal peptidase I